MSVQLGDETPVVEYSGGGERSHSERQALDQRIRQQEVLAELGVMALQGGDVNTLLTETVRLVAEGLSLELCKVLEFIPAENCFTVRAGFCPQDRQTRDLKSSRQRSAVPDTGVVRTVQYFSSHERHFARR